MIVLPHSLHRTIKATSKIAKERIWTLNSRFASKRQNREATNLDQSGHHQDCETVFGIKHQRSVARGACDFREKQAEIGISSLTREIVPDEMRTSWKVFDVTKFQEEIKIAQKTAATPYVP